MNKKKIIILVIIVTIIVTIFTCLVCVHNYLDLTSYTKEKIVEIKDSDDVIVLREFETLFSEGVRVYYKSPFGRKVQLGGVSGDAQTFSYSYIVYDDHIKVFYRSNEYRHDEQNFEYPKKWYEKIFG